MSRLGEGSHAAADSSSPTYYRFDPLRSRRHAGPFSGIPSRIKLLFIKHLRLIWNANWNFFLDFFYRNGKGFGMNDLPSYWSRLMSREEAEALLAPYYEHFIMCVQEGFEFWTSFAAQLVDHRRPLSNRTRATFINDHIVSRAKDIFEAEKGVRMDEEFGFLCLNFGERAIVHFKKLDEEGRPSSYPTDQQKRIAMQELPMPDCPEPTWLSVGYQLKFPASGDQIDKILISCCFADKAKWTISLYDSAEESGDTARLPFPPPPSEQPRTRRVRPKNIRDVDG